MANSIDSVKLIQKEIELVINQLKEANKEIIKLSESARNVSSSFKGVKAPEGINKGLRESKENTEQLNAIIKEQERLERLLISTIAKKTLTQEATARAVTKEREELKILNREQRNQVKAVSELSTAYEKLSSETNLLIREYKDLAVQQKNGANLTDLQKKRFDTLGKTIKNNQKVLKDTDAEVGQFSRNVGNYAGSFNGLAVSVAQIAREAPAAAVSLNTFVLGISNNIPQLQDELTRLIAKNKELVAQGKPTVNVFKSLASALVSPQVILAGLVTVFTLYNKQIFEFISRVTKGAEKTRDLAQQQKILNEAYTEGAKSASSEIAQLQLLLAFSSDVTKSTKDRNKAVDKLIKSSGGLITEQDRLNILNGEAVKIENKLVKAILNRAIVQQLQSKISEDINKLLDKQIELGRVQQERNITISKTDDAIIKALKNGVDVRNEDITIKEKGIEVTRRVTEAEINQAIAVREALKLSDKGAFNSRRSNQLDERANTLKKESTTVQENINNLIKEALKLTDSYTLSLDENNDKLEERARVTALNVRSTEEQVKELNKLSKVFDALFKDDLTPDLEGLQDVTEELNRFNQAVTDDLIKAFDKQILDDAFNDLSNTIGLFTGSNAQVFKNFFDTVRSGFSSIPEIAGASFDVIGEVANAFYDQSIERINQQIDENRLYYEDILANEELTEAERTKAEKDREDKEKQLIARKRKEQKKQAEINRALAIADIIINTASGVVEALPNIPLSVAVGIIGATQLGLALSTPIPQFAEGGVMDHDGLMQINDHKSGRLEIVERDGKLLMSNQKNAIVQGKKGDIIHKDAKEFLNNVPEEDLLKNINKYTMIATIQSQMNSALRIENKKIVDSQKIMTDRIVKAIQRNKTSVVVNNNNNIGRELSYLKRGDF